MGWRVDDVGLGERDPGLHKAHWRAAAEAGRLNTTTTESSRLAVGEP